MEFNKFIAGKDDSHRRLDKIVSRIFESNNVHTGIFPLIRKGLIKVNGKKAQAESRINEGDEIAIARFLFDDSQAELSVTGKKDISLSIDDITLFRNGHILVLNKPSGINVQPSKDSDWCLADLVEEDFKNRNNNNSLSFKPGPLHRIDRYTSGLVVFSQSLEGARWFTDNMKTHSFSKDYLGITQGEYKENYERYLDIIDAPETSSDQTFGTVTVNGKKGKPAITNAKFLKKIDIDGFPGNLIEFNIETGRKHQIRAQSAYHGHPLLGDTAYGGMKLKNKMFYLHARRLGIPENDLDIPAEIIAPCDFFLQ